MHPLSKVSIAAIKQNLVPMTENLSRCSVLIIVKMIKFQVNLCIRIGK